MIDPVLSSAMKIAGLVAGCLTLPGSVELLLVSAAALIAERRRASPPTSSAWRAAVVVPAHDEQVTITGCVQSLTQANASMPGTGADLFVVADNCTDDTASLAALAGAHVLVRTDPIHRGKGYALHYAFAQLLPLGYDCVLVVDADTHVAANFLATMTSALQAGADGVQARYLVRNARETMRSRLMRVALLAFNLVRPLGRERLGLSCGIFGNGFGLRRETILAVPYLAASLVEDLEYHLELVRSGRRVTFLNHTAVYSEMPVKTKDIKSQRARWEGGRLRMLTASAPALCRDVLAGKLRCLEPLLDLLLLPLAFHITLLAIALATPFTAARDVGVAGVLIVAFHLVVALVRGGGDASDVAVLAIAPFYVLWKILLVPTLLRNARPGERWVRTGRNAEQEPPKPASAQHEH